MYFCLDFSDEHIEDVKSKFRKEVKRGPFYKDDAKWIFDINNVQLFRDAVWQGYLDACRTFRGIKLTTDNRDAFNNLASSIKEYFESKDATFMHSEWCNTFITEVNEVNGYHARYGQAQKVVNMAFKYLFCCDRDGAYDEKFSCCHMPLDDYTLLWLFFETGTWYRGWSWFDKNLYEDAQKKVKGIYNNNILEKELVIWDTYSRANIKDLKRERKEDHLHIDMKVTV